MTTTRSGPLSFLACKKPLQRLVEPSAARAWQESWRGDAAADASATVVEGEAGGREPANPTRSLEALLTPAAVQACSTWLELLTTWNARMDLTAARDEAELCDLMLADALVLATRIPERARVVDVGTGAGAPGLPLALVRPDLALTLVEPLTKRVAFLRTVLGTIGREDVTLVRGRSEELIAKAGTKPFDAALSRATLAPARWLATGAALTHDGGEVLVLLAREEAPAAEAIAPGVAPLETVTYAWPNTQATRRIVRYARRA